MIVNRNKTKVMVVGEEQETINIEIEGESIEQVGSFQYLGVEIEENGKHEIEERGTEGLWDDSEQE